MHLIMWQGNYCASKNEGNPWNFKLYWGTKLHGVSEECCQKKKYYATTLARGGFKFSKTEDHKHCRCYAFIDLYCIRLTHRNTYGMFVFILYLCKHIFNPLSLHENFLPSTYMVLIHRSIKQK